MLVDWHVSCFFVRLTLHKPGLHKVRKNKKPKKPTHKTMKKFIALLAVTLLGIQWAGAQEDRGEQTVSNVPVTRTTTETVSVSDGKSLNKKVVIEEEEDKWWAVNAYTGWDSLYMFRGVNVLGNGRGIYWLGGNVAITPWENGTITPGIWYGTSTSRSRNYNELDVSLDYTHTFGALAASFGWIYYYYPDNFGLGGPDLNQNELYWKLAYGAEIGSVTITPSATYFLNVGPNLGNGGWTLPNASYLLLRVDASMPLYKEIVSLAPWTAFGVNFGFNANNQGNTFDGGNNWELGLAMPVQITDWFKISGYVAYSYQWADLVGTDENTWWAGASANFSF